MDSHGSQNPGSSRPQVLATDLDGTFIPLPDNRKNQADLAELRAAFKSDDIDLVFVTGRHLSLVLDAIRESDLPHPDWIISDVGTSLYARDADTQVFHLVQEYQTELARITANLAVEELRQRLKIIPELRLQETEKQTQFKLSYYCDAQRIEEVASAVDHVLRKCQAPYSLVHSIDPFTGDGLVDLLPIQANKAFALRWWKEFRGLQARHIVFAGDSGNDLAAMTADYRCIVVGNAPRSLARCVFDHHTERETLDLVYFAEQHATSGVLEGAQWFGLIPKDNTAADSVATPAAYISSAHTAYLQVWAPHRRTVEVELLSELSSGDEQNVCDPARHLLSSIGNGYFAAEVPASVGQRYWYVLDGQERRPDPVSHFQPDGVHGPSQLVRCNSFPWSDSDWRGVAKRDLVIYELHLGAFTEQGTYQAAEQKLQKLVELGVTAIELMPLAQSPGQWNWGYDGVNFFAPRNTYGSRDNLKAFVDRCHHLGIAVILDVVYNHFGPEGNYLRDFGPYFTEKHHTPWGQALNFDGEQSEFVRQFIVENALYWLREFHLDGLRLDAVHFLLDDSQPSIVHQLREAIQRFEREQNRTLHLIAESNVYDHELLRPSTGRRAYDAVWCDCLMHSIYAQAVPELRLTQRTYHGKEEIAEVLRYGYLYHYQDGKQRRVGPAKERREKLDAAEIASFIIALQTHDSIGNHPLGRRMHQLTSEDYQRAAAALVILYPAIPMIFMGEESSCDSPFPFFVDFEDPRLRREIDEARMREYPQHQWEGNFSPSDPTTFHAANCDKLELHNSETWDWYQLLLKIRRAGLTSGWLNYECLSVSHQPDTSLFSLHYRSDACEVDIHVHLPNSAFVSEQISISGEILASSKQVEGDAACQPESPFNLSGDHCLVVKRDRTTL